MERSQSGNLPNRAAPGYLDEVLERIFARNRNALVNGVSASAPPDNFDELVAIADATRNPDCGGSAETDNFVAIVAALPDRDDVCRRLPYDPDSQTLALILPEED